MCKNAIKKLSFVIRYNPDQYKTQGTCEKVGGMLMFVPNFYKIWKMCIKAVDNYAHALEFMPDCYKTQ